MELERNRLYKAKNGDEVRLLSETIDCNGDVALLDAENCLCWIDYKDLTPLTIDEYFLKHIDKPFCLLSEDAQKALIAINNSKNIQFISSELWSNIDKPGFVGENAYRLDPEWEPELEPETVIVKIAKKDLRLLDGIKYEEVKK